MTFDFFVGGLEYITGLQKSYTTRVAQDNLNYWSGNYILFLFKLSVWAMLLCHVASD